MKLDIVTIISVRWRNHKLSREMQLMSTSIGDFNMMINVISTLLSLDGGWGGQNEFNILCTLL